MGSHSERVQIPSQLLIALCFYYYCDYYLSTLISLLYVIVIIIVVAIVIIVTITIKDFGPKNHIHYGSGDLFLPN